MRYAVPVMATELTFRVRDRIAKEISRLPDPEEFVNQALETALQNQPSKPMGGASRWARLVTEIESLPEELLPNTQGDGPLDLRLARLAGRELRQVAVVLQHRRQARLRSDRGVTPEWASVSGEDLELAVGNERIVAGS